MKIQILASGSKGNCYLIEDGHTSVLIDAGITYREINKKLNFKSSRINGVLITHEHGDHANGIPSIDGKLACKIYMTQGTFYALPKQPMMVQLIVPLVQFELGTFLVLPFTVEHDAAHPVGYLIKSNVTNEQLLFATDTAYLRYTFGSVNYLMVECNYDEQTLNSRVAAGHIDSFLAERVKKSHMGLATVVELIKANDLKKLRQIYLLHMSDGNANEDLIKRKIQEVSGAQVIVC